MRFEIDWASLIVGSKFTVFALLDFVFEGNFPSTSPWRAYIWRGDLTEGFLRSRFGGLIFCIWRGLYIEGLIFGILRYFCKFVISQFILLHEKFLQFQLNLKYLHVKVTNLSINK